jgi:hypothetical protein
MRTLVTRILWLAVTGALLYGGFVAYERWWDGDLSLVKERVLSFVNDSADEVKERAVEAGSEALDEVKEEATERAKSAISSVIGGAIESIGETIAQYGESVAGAPSAASVPAVSGGSYQTPPPPVALTAEVGEELSFAVNEGTRYTATWGEGSSDEGNKETTASVLLHHAWAAPGDYTVTLVTEINGTSRTETFPVRIYE